MSDIPSTPALAAADPQAGEPRRRIPVVLEDSAPGRRTAAIGVTVAARPSTRNCLDTRAGSVWLTAAPVQATTVFPAGIVSALAVVGLRHRTLGRALRSVGGVGLGIFAARRINPNISLLHGG